MKYCDIKKLEAESRTGKWWEKIKKEGQKWSLLRHNGVYFPEPYTPLPKNIKVLYNKKPVELDSKNTKNPFNMSAEEAMVLFAQMVDRDERLKNNKKRHRYSEDQKFRENFWNDWKIILGKTPIKDFNKLDFTSVARYVSERSENKKLAKKELTKEEKAEEKKQKNAIVDLYGYAIVDGKKIGMEYSVELPGLYQGHGKHPLRGKIKKRLQPSDITLNVSKEYIPKCFIHGKPCKWGDVVENKDVTWIASWKDPITEDTKYRFLKRIESHFVCAGDMDKFEKARRLDENIDMIRKKYKLDLANSNQEIRQLATAVYLLDILAIRPGIEKDEEKEAGTLGLTTLKCENITFEEDKHITIDFIGKSSIQFKKKFKVDGNVYNNLKSSCRTKKQSNKLFPSITATSLNKYLKSILNGLTAKVFRTWKASNILQKELNKNILDIYTPTYEKQLSYNKVNLEVAKELNHKKLTDSDDRIVKLKNKIKELKQKYKETQKENQKKTILKSIAMQEAKLEEAEMNISMGTSKLNYMDPRISVAWAKKVEIPIEKIYNKTQLKKFVWAMDVVPNWTF